MKAVVGEPNYCPFLVLRIKLLAAEPLQEFIGIHGILKTKAELSTSIPDGVSRVGICYIASCDGHRIHSVAISPTGNNSELLYDRGIGSAPLKEMLGS
jgi:hypothetical protein